MVWTVSLHFAIARHHGPALGTGPDSDLTLWPLASALLGMDGAGVGLVVSVFLFFVFQQLVFVCRGEEGVSIFFRCNLMSGGCGSSSRFIIALLQPYSPSAGPCPGLVLAQLASSRGLVPAWAQDHGPRAPAQAHPSLVLARPVDPFPGPSRLGPRPRPWCGIV